MQILSSPIGDQPEVVPSRDELLEGAAAALDRVWCGQPLSTIVAWGTCIDTVWLRSVLPPSSQACHPDCPWDEWRTGPAGALAIPRLDGATHHFLNFLEHKKGQMAAFVLDAKHSHRLLLGCAFFGERWKTLEASRPTLRKDLEVCPDKVLALFQGFGRMPFRAFSNGHEGIVDAELLARKKNSDDMIAMPSFLAFH